MLKGFKKFILRGNIIDLSVGVMVGGAFSKISTSLVNDVMMPAISIITGKIDFNNLFIALDGQKYATLEEAKALGVSTINYGSFLTTIIDFLIIAFVTFIIINQLNKLNNKLSIIPEEEVTTKTCPFCKSSISKDATRCPHCTSELEIKATAKS